jgi:hypothetical protein
MLTIIPERPSQESKARQIARALRNSGCDVWVDEGYANDIDVRSSTGGKYVLFLMERNMARSIVTLHNRWDDTYYDYTQKDFVNNWGDYLED